MKKLLIATVIAAAASTTAYAAPLVLTYDVEVAGITYRQNGSQKATIEGVGTARVLLDPELVLSTGLFLMTVDNTITQTFPGVSGTVTRSMAGYFTQDAFLVDGDLSFHGDVSVSKAYDCVDIETFAFLSICGQNPINTRGIFAIDEDSMAMTGAGDIIQFTETEISPFFWGSVTAVSNYTLTLVSMEGQEVPVPAAAWLFGSALVGLAGMGRKRKAA